MCERERERREEKRERDDGISRKWRYGVEGCRKDDVCSSRLSVSSVSFTWPVCFTGKPDAASSSSHMEINRLSCRLGCLAYYAIHVLGPPLSKPAEGQGIAFGLCACLQGFYRNLVSAFLTHSTSFSPNLLRCNACFWQ